MLFLKIKDPIKRNLIVEEFLKTKKNIQEKFSFYNPRMTTNQRRHDTAYLNKRLFLTKVK